MLTSEETIFSMGTDNYCFSTEYTFPCGPGGTFKMYIPKLMSVIGFGGSPKTETVSFQGDSIFANADECKPSCGSSFSSKNFLEPTLLRHASEWDHILDGQGKVPLKTKFLLHTPNGNPDIMYFDTHL